MSDRPSVGGPWRSTSLLVESAEARAPRDDIELQSVPVLFVSDVSATDDYFVDRLGFCTDFLHGEPPFYGSVSRAGARLHLRRVQEPVIRADLAEAQLLLAAYIEVATIAGLHALHDEFSSSGADLTGSVATERWGASAFTVRDPDGNLIYFTASPQIAAHTTRRTSTCSGAVVYAQDVLRVAHFYAELLNGRVVTSEGSAAVLSRTAAVDVVGIPDHIARTITLTDPPTRRRDTALKLVLTVPSIGEARVIAAQVGGVLDPADHEWRHGGLVVCDGHDPEGNVFQLRQRGSSPSAPR